jgi:cytochrome c oxidase assembly protein subunit 15
VNNPARHRFAVFTAVATLILLGAGGLVTSHGVGMAVPDWPNTFGYNMFFFPVSQWVGGVFYEHTHRLLASGVGLLTTILALWLYGKNARTCLRWAGSGLVILGIVTGLVTHSRWADAVVLGVSGLIGLASSFVWPRCEAAKPWLRKLGVIAFFGVVLQGVLGGLRVVLFKDQIGILHATVAQLFFVLICMLALFTSPWWNEIIKERTSPIAPTRLSWLSLMGAILILAQLILGATMRHQHAGLAIPDFPLAYGKVWPAIDPQAVALYNQQRLEVVAANPITAFQIVLQMIHRLGAVVIFCIVAWCAWSAWREFGARHRVTRLAAGWLALILLQVSLGAATIWSNKAADLATAHVLVGAISLAIGAVVITLLRLETAVRSHSVPALVRSKIEPSGTFQVTPAPVIGIE